MKAGSRSSWPSSSTSCRACRACGRTCRDRRRHRHRGPGETQLETDRRSSDRRSTRSEGAGRAGPPPALHRGAGSRSAGDPDGRDRRLHERGQVDAAQRARRRRGRDGRGQAVRDARPHGAPGSGSATQSAIVTDTVGFIHKLPHQLVDAFRATLEEVNRADVLLEVVDAADPHLASTAGPSRSSSTSSAQGQAAPYRLQQGRPPGARRPAMATSPGPASQERSSCSALTGYGLDTLRAEIAALAALWVDLDVAVPYAAGSSSRGSASEDRRGRVPRLAPRSGKSSPSRAGSRPRRVAGARPVLAEADTARL